MTHMQIKQKLSLYSFNDGQDNLQSNEKCFKVRYANVTSY